MAGELNKVRIAGESSGSFPADRGSAQASNADTLVEWLGSFWTEVYEDPEFIKDIQSARALRAAQLYLDLLENLGLEDRENAPVFHRERWHPIVIRKSKRNTGSGGLASLTSATTGEVDELGPVPEINLGPQRSNVYRPCTMVTLGGRDAHYSGMVVYPLEGVSSGIGAVATCISDSVVSASVVLGSGTDFAILGGSIAISEEQDPFTGVNADKFPKFDVLGGPGEHDQETVLWACDALFDKDFIYRHLGYALGLPAKSSEIYKRVVNSAWNAVASGATPLLVKSLMASICGIPTVKTDGEKVERVVNATDGGIQVITDRNVYTLGKGSRLREDVKAGAVMRRFDTLDTAIRVYPCVTDARRLPLYNEFASDFREFTEDVPAIDLPPAFFRSDVRSGFSVDWGLKDVVYMGNDANGNPRLRFSIGGSAYDEDLFWSDTWRRYEAAGKSMEDCLYGIQYDKIYEIGATWCQISPMEFFMRNLIGANTLIMTVRTDTLPDDAPLYDPKFFGVLRDVIPAYIRLYVVEHSSVSGDVYDIGSGTRDEADLFVEATCEDRVVFRRPGKRCGRGLSVRESVFVKWIASCGDGDGDGDDND